MATFTKRILGGTDKGTTEIAARKTGTGYLLVTTSTDHRCNGHSDPGGRFPDRFVANTTNRLKHERNEFLFQSQTVHKATVKQSPAGAVKNTNRNIRRHVDTGSWHFLLPCPSGNLLSDYHHVAAKIPLAQSLKRKAAAENGE